MTDVANSKNPAPLSGGNRALGRVVGQPPDTTAPVVDQTLRRQHWIEVVHQLGPRIVFELLDEIARHHDLRDDIDRRLAAFAELDPDILRALGGDKFPAAPIHSVERD